ncbi:hypothetical protein CHINAEXTREME_05835 [Halobiforma lacisalsi AJ5]|uniref:Uncharacterized protein n=1 Tax=Natronobacterium lacisalsi AJ5 TaxID=358396 RepID=M0LJX6_NATLA|nr:hypothetical protein [Halobiforma lacisalsi]APW97322.1 hypothetical protein CHINAEXTREME_05835 [Halobiforma lacisalsi AJ5]EMA33836.1 hypothetical protein C445_09109 [Halobiforma lacisalsi AJ5]
MTLLPVDTDVLEDVCRDIAQDNYGFIYVSDQKGEIKSAYESADVGLVNARSLSSSDMRKALTEMAADEFVDLEQLRDGVFYVDPFGVKGNMNITRELTNLFGQRLVVTGETLRSRFSLAIDDMEFFADELADRNYLRRITAGKRDYYTIGPQLKEHADDVGLDSRLEREASNGKIAHSDLESVIDVDATSDVIRYLDREGYIVDLDGEYLVEEAIDEYGRYLAEEIEEAVENEFEESSYVLRVGEFDQVVENEIESRFDVLSQARSVRGEILEETRATLVDRLGLEEGREMVEATDPFEDVVEDHARRILTDLKAEQDQLPGTLPEWIELAEEHFTELQVSSTTAVNEHVRDAVRERYRSLVNEEEFGGMAA